MTMNTIPLAHMLRPESLNDFIGQDHILSEGKVLKNILESRKPVSMVFWGPPGCGKTTMAYIVAKEYDLPFKIVSAVTTGIPEVKKIIEKASEEYRMFQKPLIMIVDEIHRFNKAQQDAFLPHIENGTIIIIGATTENPSFSLNNALLSRIKVIVFESLSEENIRTLLNRACQKAGFDIESDVESILFQYSGGDARKVLNTLEIFLNMGKYRVSREILTQIIKGDFNASYDRNGEYHYDLISAFHKSLRGSDADAAVYWMMRMIESGEDPLYIIRRMIRFASEDIGLADPNAIVYANACLESVRFLGMPEGDNAMIQCVVYLSLAPKSNSIYMFGKKIREISRQYNKAKVPLHLRNAPTSLMEDIGYGKEYKYAHNYENGIVKQQYLPDELHGKSWFEPKDSGFEKKAREKYQWIRKKIY